LLIYFQTLYLIGRDVAPNFEKRYNRRNLKRKEKFWERKNQKKEKNLNKRPCR
jgi:hypothetical protein